MFLEIRPHTTRILYELRLYGTPVHGRHGCSVCRSGCRLQSVCRAAQGAHRAPHGWCCEFKEGYAQNTCLLSFEISSYSNDFRSLFYTFTTLTH